MNEFDEELEKIFIKKRRFLSQFQIIIKEFRGYLNKFSEEVGMEIDILDSSCYESGKIIIKNFQEIFIFYGEEILKV